MQERGGQFYAAYYRSLETFLLPGRPGRADQELQAQHGRPVHIALHQLKVLLRLSGCSKDLKISTFSFNFQKESFSPQNAG